MSLTNGNGPMTPQNGTTEKPLTIVGINFGNTYASIAVITKTGIAECIANEDGERQIACAISFHGEEILIGNQAKPQLVKNADNTITGFRNLLGKKFSELPKDKPVTSAPVIQHPDLPDVPAYKVQVLQPAPTPIAPTPSVRSTVATPLASQLATPRSEPIPAERILTVLEVNTLFLKSLIQSAQDFLGNPVDGAVISVPSWFDENARVALEVAAKDAGIEVLQLLDDVAAASVISSDWNEDGMLADRLTLVVDLGQSSLSLSLLSVRHGLTYVMGSSNDDSIGGEQIDERLVKFFAKEFTKKTKVPLAVCPSTDKADKRAEAKLRIAIEHTKRTLSASAGAATCSVESLKDGVDFTGSINRMRFDMEMRPIYDKVHSNVIALLQGLELEELHLDEIVYVGGSACLPGLDETFFMKDFPEHILTPFATGMVNGGGPGDPTTMIARGCAKQAKIISAIPVEDVKVKEAFKTGSELSSAKVTKKAIGILFPEDDTSDLLGGQWVAGVPKATPLPYRRIIQLDADLGEGEAEGKKIGFELWEAGENVLIEKTIYNPPKIEDEDGEIDLDPEDMAALEEYSEQRDLHVEKETYLGSLSLVAKHAQKENGRWKTRMEVHFIVEIDGKVAVTAWEVFKGIKGKPVEITVPAPSS